MRAPLYLVVVQCRQQHCQSIHTIVWVATFLAFHTDHSVQLLAEPVLARRASHLVRSPGKGHRTPRRLLQWYPLMLGTEKRGSCFVLHVSLKISLSLLAFGCKVSLFQIESAPLRQRMAQQGQRHVTYRNRVMGSASEVTNRLRIVFETAGDAASSRADTHCKRFEFSCIKAFNDRTPSGSSTWPAVLSSSRTINALNLPPSLPPSLTTVSSG